MSPEYIFLSLSVSLLLTVALELMFALLFKIRGRTLIIVILVNILTNPAVVVLYLLLCRHYTFPPLAVVPILEVSAFLAEALIYKTRCRSIQHPFIFALGANLFSYLCGVVIGTLI